MKKLLLFALIALNLTYQLAAKEKLENVVIFGDSLSDVNFYNTSTFLPAGKKATFSGFTGKKDTCYSGILCDMLGIPYKANNKSVPPQFRDKPLQTFNPGTQDVGIQSSGTLDGNIFAASGATCATALQTAHPAYPVVQPAERQIDSFGEQCSQQNGEYFFNGISTKKTLVINAISCFNDSFIIVEGVASGQIPEPLVPSIVKSQVKTMLEKQADLQKIGVSLENNIMFIFPYEALLSYMPFFAETPALKENLIKVMDLFSNEIKTIGSNLGLKIIQYPSDMVDETLGDLTSVGNGLPGLAIKLSGYGPMTTGNEGLGYVADKANQFEAFTDSVHPGFYLDYAFAETMIKVLSENVDFN